MGGHGLESFEVYCNARPERNLCDALPEIWWMISY